MHLFGKPLKEVLLGAIVILIVTWYIYFQLKRRRLYKLAKQFNGPRPLPIIGNILSCLIQSSEFKEKALKSASYYKSPVRLWIGPYLVILIYDPKNAELVLNNTHALDKLPYYSKLLEFITGPGVSTIPVTKWRKRRKLIAPVFNQKYLHSFFDVLYKHSQTFIRNLEIKANNKLFDVNEDTVRYAMCSSMEALLGFDADTDSSSNVGVVLESLHRMLTCMTVWVTKMWFLPDRVFFWTSYGRMAIEAKKKYYAFFDMVIQNWEKKSAEKHVESSKSSSNTEVNNPKKFIEHLLSISEGSGALTLEELRSEINTVIASGLETTSTSLGFILVALGIHPDIQERVYHEVIEVTGSRPHLEYEDLKHLQYLDRVIKESLRIFPTLPGIIRCNDQEINLEKHTIPADSTIVIGPLNLHWDPNLWPNPSTFNPDRFLPEEEAKRHPYSFIPFSAGPRNCVGMRFALLSLKIAVATFVRKYKIITDYKSIDAVHLTLILDFHPTNGFKIGITSR